jgi:3',5'-cyclic AMP phosphodiesterase CpdA
LTGLNFNAGTQYRTSVIFFIAQNTNILKISKHQTIRFFVIGDWGRPGSLEQQHTASQMARQAEMLQPDFIVSTGDNFYDNGVSSPQDPLWEEVFERVYFQDSLQIPWYCVLGNHDYGGNTGAQFAYSQLSDRWHMPAPFYKQHFTKASNSLEVFFTDTSPFIQEYWESGIRPDLHLQKPEVQLEWLAEQLAVSQARHKIVVGHHPVFSSSPMHGDTEVLKAHFLPLFEEFGVSAYLCGHEHDIQLQQAAGKTVYLVSGAGSEIRATDRNEMTLYSGSVSGFACITIAADNMEIRVIDAEGKTQYQWQNEAFAGQANASPG